MFRLHTTKLWVQLPGGEILLENLLLSSQAMKENCTWMKWGKILEVHKMALNMEVEVGNQWQANEQEQLLALESQVVGLSHKVDGTRIMQEEHILEGHHELQMLNANLF
jgi:hypothetical protein